MRLIEKECPNCGAGLSFTENDKSCKCEYCKREFEIERDRDKAKALVDQFDLTPIKGFAKTFVKVFGIYTIGSFIASFIIMIVTLIVIGLIILAAAKSIPRDSSIDDDPTLIEEVSDLTSRDYDALDLNAKVTIIKNNNSLGDYSLKGYPKRKKIYILYKDDENILIPVYKTTYQNFFQPEHTYTIYIPVTFKNVKSKNNSIALSLGNGKIEAPEYYFNLEHSDYAYGYQDLDSLNEEIINNYSDYSIEEK